MKHLRHIALVAHLLLLSQISGVSGTDLNDGEWIGSATSTDWRCKPASITLTIEGKAVTGQAKFQVEAVNINGTVLQDGMLGATVGFRHLTGQFIKDEFAGTFRSADCAWKVILKRKKLP
jgi:hypothetical protein